MGQHATDFLDEVLDPILFDEEGYYLYDDGYEDEEDLPDRP
jgi:hypothetical protein